MTALLDCRRCRQKADVTQNWPAVTQARAGFVRTRRYFCENTDIRYLAWYETTDEQVEAGPHFQHIVVNPTPWSLRMRKLYGDQRERMNFKLMCEVGSFPAPDAPWMYIVHTDIPDHIVDDYNAWYDKEHLLRCAGIPGVLRARRFTSTGILGGTTGAQDTVDLKMRSLFNNTRRALYNLVTPTVPHEQALAQKRISVA